MTVSKQIDTMSLVLVAVVIVILIAIGLCGLLITRGQATGYEVVNEIVQRPRTTLQHQQDELPGGVVHIAEQHGGQAGQQPDDKRRVKPAKHHGQAGHQPDDKRRIKNAKHDGGQAGQQPYGKHRVTLLQATEPHRLDLACPPTRRLGEAGGADGVVQRYRPATLPSLVPPASPSSRAMQARCSEPLVPCFQERERVAFKFADQRYYNATSGILSVPIDLDHCVSLELMEAAVVRTHYTIEAPYNVATLRVATTVGGNNTLTFVVTLPTRDYTYSELHAQLNTLLAVTPALEDNTKVGSTYVAVSVDVAKKTFTFSGLHGSYLYAALQFSSKQLAYILGFCMPSAYTAPVNGIDDFTSADIGSLYYPRRDAVVLAVVYGALPLSSTGQYDLSGSRYLRLECAELEHLYSNSPVIKDLPFADDVTFTSSISMLTRRFIDPVYIGRARVKMLVLMPDASCVVYNNAGLSFHVTFAVTTLIRTVNRVHEARRD